MWQLELHDQAFYPHLSTYTYPHVIHTKLKLAVSPLNTLTTANLPLETRDALT
jgi:hypothetical protein